MSEISTANKFAQNFIGEHPQLKEEVLNYFDLMSDNIEEGQSPQNELNLFIGACEDLLKD
jgi:hypothetical protein